MPGQDLGGKQKKHWNVVLKKNWWCVGKITESDIKTRRSSRRWRILPLTRKQCYRSSTSTGTMNGWEADETGRERDRNLWGCRYHCEQHSNCCIYTWSIFYPDNPGLILRNINLGHLPFFLTDKFKLLIVRNIKFWIYVRVTYLAFNIWLPKDNGRWTMNLIFL